MNRTKLLSALGLVATLVGTSQAATYKMYKERILKYQPRQPTWDAYLNNHWEDWKARFGSNGFVLGMDPSGTPSQISEAQSYALIMSVWFGDEDYFKKAWAQTVSQFQQGTHFSWKPGSDQGFAGDADQDIVGALIFASALQDSGIWTDKTYNWNALAKTWMTNIQGYIVTSGNTIKTMQNKGGELVNPSYSLFHWYPVFNDFCKKNGMSCLDWEKVRSASYAVMKANDPGNTGIVSNWCSPSGGAASSGTQSKPNDIDMGFDAIRVPWRVGLDILWYKNATAMDYGEAVWKNGKVNPSQPGMYEYSTKKLRGWGDPTKNYDGAEYEKFMTRAMWGALALPLDDGKHPNSSAAADKILSDVTWAKWSDLLKSYNYFADCCTDTLQTNGINNARKNYFAQSLAIMGTLTMAGRAWNIWDDLKNPWTIKDTSTQFLTPLKVSPDSLVLGSGASVLVTGKIDKPILWKITFTGQTSGKVFNYTTGTESADISYSWKGTGGTPASAAWGDEVVKITVTGGPWTAPLATGTTALKLKKSSSVIGTRSHASALAWTPEGLLVPEGALSAGVSYKARILDAKGAIKADLGSVVPQVNGDNTLRLTLARPASATGYRILSLSGADGSMESILLPVTR